MTTAHKARWRGKRLRDREDAPGRGVYSTWEYRQARLALLRKGAVCRVCGSAQDLQAHHRVPGDDTTLEALCRPCHAREHHGHPDAKGARPPKGEKPPVCKCGCGLPVRWKRVRGWATYRKGHGGAKIPAGQSKQPPPLCKCGCGDSVVTFYYGKGWAEYRRGHRQRVEGHYSQKR